MRNKHSKFGSGQLSADLFGVIALSIPPDHRADFRNSIGERMLRSIPLFKDLSEKDLALISDLAIDKHVTKGNVVLTEGEVGDSLYAIVSGRVKVFIGDEDGREIIL